MTFHSFTRRGDPLIAMKIIGHSDYQTTANVYTHIRDEMLKKSTVNVAEVFRGENRVTEWLENASRPWWSAGASIYMITYIFFPSVDYVD